MALIHLINPFICTILFGILEMYKKTLLKGLVRKIIKRENYQKVQKISFFANSTSIN